MTEPSVPLPALSEDQRAQAHTRLTIHSFGSGRWRHPGPDGAYPQPSKKLNRSSNCQNSRSRNSKIYTWVKSLSQALSLLSARDYGCGVTPGCVRPLATIAAWLGVWLALQCLSPHSGSKYRRCVPRSSHVAPVVPWSYHNS